MREVKSQVSILSSDCLHTGAVFCARLLACAFACLYMCAFSACISDLYVQELNARLIGTANHYQNHLLFTISTLLLISQQSLDLVAIVDVALTINQKRVGS